MTGTALYTAADQDTRKLAAIAALGDYRTAHCSLASNGRYVAGARILGVTGNRVQVELTSVNPPEAHRFAVGQRFAVPARLITTWTC